MIQKPEFQIQIWINEFRNRTSIHDPEMDSEFWYGNFPCKQKNINKNDGSKWVLMENRSIFFARK